jgi:hypothetical protein
VVVLAFLAAGGHLPGGPRRPAGRTRGDRSSRRRRLRPRRLPAVSRRALPLVGVVAVAVAGSVGATQVSAAFTDVTATSSNTWTVAGNLVQPYVAEVLADDPSVFHLLDERSGAWANDASTSHRTGAYGSVSAYGVPGALPNNPGTAVRLGGTGRVVTGGQAWQNPRRFSLELWFKTSTEDGGKLIGFEGTRDVWSHQADRHLHMRSDGRLVYGGWSLLQMRTITTPRAYNDGTWHHVVLTAEPHGQEQDAVMYVDGAPVVSGTTTRTSSYAGWWRVGYGSLPLWFGFPSGAFDGVVDQVAVYDSVLSADRVRAHYDAR